MILGVNSWNGTGLGVAGLAGAGTITQANAVLERFRPQYNRRFTVSAVNPVPAWRRLRAGTDLARVCSFCYQATVLNDNTVRVGGGTVIDIAPGPRRRGYAHARVEVRQLLDGSWRVYYGDQLIATAAATQTGELRALKARRRWAGRATGSATCRRNSSTGSTGSGVKPKTPPVDWWTNPAPMP